jgi:hypothetical protein
MFACNDFYFRFQLPLIIIHITCISLSLRRTSAPIHLTSVLGVLGTQETSCIIIVGLLERDTFDLFLPEFHKPWVIHLRETCCCSTNLCTWRPITVYKNRSVRRHHISWGFGSSTSSLPWAVVVPWWCRSWTSTSASVPMTIVTAWQLVFMWGSRPVGSSVMTRCFVSCF